MGKRIVVVGGGPAGMAAALAAAADGAEVTLLEKRPKLGKKLLATGNGRCNLAHDGPLVYFGGVDFALYTELESREALAVYADHPLHTEAKSHFFHLLSSRTAADYEV